MVCTQCTMAFFCAICLEGSHILERRLSSLSFDRHTVCYFLTVCLCSLSYLGKKMLRSIISNTSSARYVFSLPPPQQPLFGVESIVSDGSSAFFVKCLSAEKGRKRIALNSNKDRGIKGRGSTFQIWSCHMTILSPIDFFNRRYVIDINFRSTTFEQGRVNTISPEKQKRRRVGKNSLITLRRPKVVQQQQLKLLEEGFYVLKVGNVEYPWFREMLKGFHQWEKYGKRPLNLNYFLSKYL